MPEEPKAQKFLEVRPVEKPGCSVTVGRFPTDVCEAIVTEDPKTREFTATLGAACGPDSARALEARLTSAGVRITKPDLA